MTLDLSAYISLFPTFGTTGSVVDYDINPGSVTIGLWQVTGVASTPSSPSAPSASPTPAPTPSSLAATSSVTTVSGTSTFPTVTYQPGGILNITPGANLTITSAILANNNSLTNVNGTLNTPSLNILPGSFLTGSGIINGSLNNFGTVILSGMTINGATTNNGVFSGAGMMNGNLVNNGTFQPNGLVVFGNFTQTSTGLFIIQASSGTQYNQMLLDGSATLSGSIQVTGMNGYPLNFGDQYAFLTSTGPIKGEFSTIDTPEGYRGRLVIIGDPVAEILIAPTSYTEVAATPNQYQVAKALDSFIPATSGDKLVVSTLLDTLTADQFPQALNAIMPTLYQSLATTAFNLANAQNNELIQRLWGLRVAEGGGFSMSGLPANCPMISSDAGKGVLDSKKEVLRQGDDKRWGVFVDGNGIFAQATSANMLPSYSSWSGGLTTGLTYKWDGPFTTGLYAGYEGSYTKFGTNSGGSAMWDNSVRFGGFGTYGQKNAKGEAVGFYAAALVGGGYNGYHVSRVIQFPGLDRTATSSPGAGELDTMLAGGYDIKCGNLTFGPTASLQYTYLGVDSVHEGGAQSLNFSSGGWGTQSMLSSLGAHAAYLWHLNKNVVLVPQISLSWQHEFMQNPYAINGNLGGSPEFSNWSSAPLRDTLYTGVGFTVEIGNGWNTSLFYNASAGNRDLVSQNFFWSLGARF